MIAAEEEDPTTAARYDQPAMRPVSGPSAEDTAAIRRQMVEHMRGQHAADMYTLMIRCGRQPVRPPGDPVRVGRVLAATEADRLQRADLWHVDTDLSELVDAAFPTMPPFAPRPFDLPSRHGFVTFARPLTALIREAIAEDIDAANLMAVNEVGRVLAEHVNEPVPVCAVSWGPADESAVATVNGGWRRSGGVWLSFWTLPTLARSSDEQDPLATFTPDQRAAYRSMAGPLNIENECVVTWCPDPLVGGDNVDNYTIGGGLHVGTAHWTAAVMAAFTLARQGNVAEQTDQPVPRPERRRHVHAGLAEPRTVRVLSLRRGISARADQGAGDGSRRNYQHRWMVRGHWRNQWYPSVKVHRPKWIAPYLAGPEGAPLIGGDKVTRVSAPRPPST